MRVLAFPPPSLGVSSLDLGRRHIRASVSFFARPATSVRRAASARGLPYAAFRSATLRYVNWCHTGVELLQCKIARSRRRPPPCPVIPPPPGMGAVPPPAAPQ